MSNSSLGICREAAKIPMAIAKSNLPPSLGKSAGARLMVMRCNGNSNWLLSKALRTRSLLSLTAASGKPTMDNEGKPLVRCTSIVTGSA